MGRGESILRFFYRFLLTLNSTILLVVVFLIKEQMVLPIPHISCKHISYLIYLLGTIILSGGCLWLSRFLSMEIISGGVKEIESANNAYLPSYLGYFFVAVSVNDVDTLIWIYIIIFLFIFNSQTLFFNPMFLLFGYKFYYISMESGMKMFVISRKEIKHLRNVKFDKIQRINDYTFIDRRE